MKRVNLLRMRKSLIPSFCLTLADGTTTRSSGTVIRAGLQGTPQERASRRCFQVFIQILYIFQETPNQFHQNPFPILHKRLQTKGPLHNS